MDSSQPDLERGDQTNATSQEEHLESGVNAAPSARDVIQHAPPQDRPIEVVPDRDPEPLPRDPTLAAGVTHGIYLL